MPEALTALRSVRGVHTAIADGCTFGCRCAVTDQLSNSWMAVRDDSAIPRKENAAKVCLRSSSRAANSGSADASTNAKSHRNQHPTSQRRFGSCSVCGSSRRHVRRGRIWRYPRSPALFSTDQYLGHPKSNVISGTHTRPNKRWKLHETSNALLAKLPNTLESHDSPLRSKSNLLSKSIARDVKELQGWIPGEKGENSSCGM